MSMNEIGSSIHGESYDRKIRSLKHNVARWTEDGSSTAGCIPNLFFFRREEPSAPETVMYEPCICILTQGAKRVHAGSGSFDYDSRHFLVAAVNIPTVVEVIDASPKRPCLGVVLTIDRREVAQLLLDFELPTPRRQRSRLGISTGKVTLPLLDAVCRLVDLLDTPEDVPILSPMIQREILYRLLTSEQGERLRQIVKAGSQSHQISQAIDWLKDNFAKPLRVDDLAAQVNMSTSTFHHHFRALTARSPLQFQKWLRLNEARRLMLVEHFDASTAAYRVGYESASQFSREYSRLFGNAPVRDISSLRRRMESGACTPRRKQADAQRQ